MASALFDTIRGAPGWQKQLLMFVVEQLRDCAAKLGCTQDYVVLGVSLPTWLVCGLPLVTYFLVASALWLGCVAFFAYSMCWALWWTLKCAHELVTRTSAGGVSKPSGGEDSAVATEARNVKKEM